MIAGLGSSFVSTVPAYLIAHHAKSQLWHTSTLLFGFFLTEACGIGAAAMGWIMAASLLLNGLVDLGLGAWLRHRVTDERSARRLQARGCPLTCAFFVLFCATPLVPADGRTIWAFEMLLGFRATYPLLDLPQNTVAAMLPLSDHARCALLAQRNVASGVAAISVSAIAAPLLIHRSDLSSWMVWAGVLSLFACGTAWWLALAPKGGVASKQPLSTPVQSGPAFAPLLGALAVMIAASAMFRLIEPYYAAFAGNGTGLLLWAAIGGTASQPLWAWCRRRWSGASALIVAATLLLASAAVLLSPARCFPGGAALVGSMFGMGSGGLWLMLWAAMMERAAQGSATRYVGAFTCTSKTAQAAAILVTGHVLAASPYRAAMRDPFSPPSLLMVGALVVIAAVCLALATLHVVSRTPSDERSARPPRVARTDRAPV